MKPPFFIECSVCGREFGSKSIVIHEPQCLQKLRRTEIAQQEQDNTPPPSITKKTRRKKKTTDRKNSNNKSSPSPGSGSGSGSGPGSGDSANNPLSSFVLLTTTSSSSLSSMEKFNLPKIQNTTNGSSYSLSSLTTQHHQYQRPCTAVLDKPRILNPEYIQYDMSLTRIDFTGQSSPLPSTMDENQNSRLQRQNTQTLDNASRRHDFALPTVVDGATTVTMASHGTVNTKQFHNMPSLLPSAANIMTTVDSILGDPQKKTRGPHGHHGQTNGVEPTVLPRESGKILWDDPQYPQHQSNCTPNLNSNTKTLMSLWSQEVFFMNMKTLTKSKSKTIRISSSFLPPIQMSVPTTNPLVPSNSESSTDILPPAVVAVHTTPTESDTSDSHPIESIFASPNFPFFGKLSHCDLEKPLRTCFHLELEKIPGHNRHAFEIHQDNFVTPSNSTTEFSTPQLIVQQSTEASTSASTTVQTSIPRNNTTPSNSGNQHQYGPPELVLIHERQPHQQQQQYDQQPHQRQQEQVTLSEETGSETDSDSPNDNLGAQLRQGTFQEQEGRQSKEIVILKNVPRNTSAFIAPSVDGWAGPDPSVHEEIGREREREREKEREREREQFLTDPLSWIGEPFMKQHSYFSAPFAAKAPQTAQTESDPELYGTPMGESEDEFSDAMYPSVQEIIDDLKRIMNRDVARRKANANSGAEYVQHIDVLHDDTKDNDNLNSIYNIDYPEPSEPAQLNKCKSENKQYEDENSSSPYSFLSNPNESIGDNTDNTIVNEVNEVQNNNEINSHNEIESCTELSEMNNPSDNYPTYYPQESDSISPEETAEKKFKCRARSKRYFPRHSNLRSSNLQNLATEAASDADDEGCESPDIIIPINTQNHINFLNGNVANSRHSNSRSTFQKERSKLKRVSSTSQTARITTTSESQMNLTASSHRKTKISSYTDLNSGDINNTENLDNLLDGHISPTTGTVADDALEDEDSYSFLFPEFETNFLKFKLSASSYAGEFPEDDDEFENLLSKNLFTNENDVSNTVPIRCGTTERTHNHGVEKVNEVECKCCVRNEGLRCDSSSFSSHKDKGVQDQDSQNKNTDALFKASTSDIDTAPQFQNPKEEQMFLQDKLSREKERRRRPLNTRPRTADSIKDSVTIWEGSHMLQQEIRSRSSRSRPFTQGNDSAHSIPANLEPMPERRPQTRRREMNPLGHENRSRSRPSTSDSRGTSVERKVMTGCELHREKQKQEKNLVDNAPVPITLTKRPQTSPPIGMITCDRSVMQKETNGSSPTKNRPSTSIPSSYKNKFLVSQDQDQFKTTKNKEVKPKPSKRPKIKKTASQSNNSSMAETRKIRGVKFIEQQTQRPATVNTMTFTEASNYKQRPGSFFTKKSPHTSSIGKSNLVKYKAKGSPQCTRPNSSPCSSSRASYSCCNSNYTTDDEPLELIFSFKAKNSINRKKSPVEVRSPVEECKHNKEELYRQIEFHRRQALYEAKSYFKQKAQRKNSYDSQSSSPACGTTPTTPSSSASPIYKGIPSHRPPSGKSVLKQLTKKVQLSRRNLVNDPNGNVDHPIPKQKFATQTVQRQMKLNKKMSRPSSGQQSLQRCSAKYKQQTKTLLDPTKFLPPPIPMSKRVHFSSPSPSGKKNGLTLKQANKVNQATGTGTGIKFSPNSQTNGNGRFKISIKTSSAKGAGQGQIKMSFKNGKQELPLALVPRTKKGNRGNDIIDINGNLHQVGKGKIAPTSVIINTALNTEQMDSTVPASSRDTVGDVSASDTQLLPQKSGGSPEEQRKQNDENAEQILENYEIVRDRIRGKEFDRRKRGKHDNKRRSEAPSTATLLFPGIERKADDKMADVKVIVRRKNKDGSFPAIENVVQSFANNAIYIIVDEEPLTKSGPNPYIEPLQNRAKPRGTENVVTLKITTSDQSSIGSLSSEDAANRFLTCFVCGKSINVREYPEHEKECIHENELKNKYLDEVDKRILPPKPHGTITIHHWNQFAYDSLKNKYVKCPYCNMEFFPDRPAEVETHNEACKNRPPPAPSMAKVIGQMDNPTVLLADEAQGWVVPTIEEIRRFTWNTGAERVDQYTRPASNRLKPYKKITPKGKGKGKGKVESFSK